MDNACCDDVYSPLGSLITGYNISTLLITLDATRPICRFPLVQEGRRCTQPAAKGSDLCYLHDPDPNVAERRRNARRAARVGNSKIGAEIRGVRMMVRDLVETTVSGDLHPTVKKRLSEVAGLLQVYSRLAELEVTSGEAPRFPGKGYVALPEDTAEKAREWAEGEEAKVREELVEDLSQVMKAQGHDPAPIREVSGP